MILINRTYETITPESAAEGDFASHGFLAENELVTFPELVEILRGAEMSSSCDYNTNTWATHYETDVDYSTGEVTNEAIHFSRDNAPRKAKYWLLALKLASV